MFDVPFKYLIIRSEFLTKRNKPVHFFIDLEENCELKYQDYLSAMGANYKIDLAKVGKWSHWGKPMKGEGVIA